MATSIKEVLEELRISSTSGRNRGDKFERLIAAYLRTDPSWSSRFSKVWLWNDWPGRAGKPDTGIDLVAQERETGALTAIQCKFYGPSHTLQKNDIDSFFTASGKDGFSSRLIVSTTDKWSKHAEDALRGQQIPVTRLRVQDLDESSVDWSQFSLDAPEVMKRKDKKDLRPHQTLALNAVREGFLSHARGKLIMACGTGKTLTSLRIAEDLVPTGGSVLVLVPSISLLSQTLKEWTTEAKVPLRPYAVCSDTKAGSRSDKEDISPYDLVFPATTDAAKLYTQITGGGPRGKITVIFSTYQSLSVVAEAQRKGLREFDLVICDEAHRTTGVTLAGQNESNFVKVHDQQYLKAARRLYMTATPRLYDDSSKSQAEDVSAVLASMDDETLYGPEFHRLGFGKAVDQGLLTDYKVLILTVDEGVVAKTLQEGFADGGSELALDDAAKIIGCWNAMAKRTGTFADGSGFAEGEEPMKRAVAFARSITDSKQIADRFNDIVDAYDGADDDVLRCEVEHVDGTFNALERSRRLDWLKQDPGPAKARILSNVRCLSEGVDVPNLDAVLFLHPRNSVVDVVQSVGRVMRLAPGKKYGYIILPVAIPAGMSPEKALADNKRFKTVWEVLQALRAHDDRFNATVNQIDLNKKKPDNKIGIGSIGPNYESVGGADGSGTAESDEATKDREAQNAQHIQEMLFSISDWRNAIYARIVDKVGERHYWEKWAKDIAQIANRHVTRIKTALTIPEKKAAFEEFVSELRSNINPGVSETDAVDMLAQHIVTKPVFDALFKDYGFAEHNPVSRAMQRMLDILDDQGIDAETKKLEGFYDSVRVRAEGIDNHEGRQRVITELYDKFFKTALPKTADALGIVYTPVEVVDFIIHSTEQALAKHFGRSLSDEGVQIIDPFVGTGTFPVRLLQSGLIKPKDLQRKYASELHANEIVLLAYYIAAVNIEAAFHDLAGGEYRPFEGIVLTDTFQLAEGAATFDGMEVLEGNSERAKRQQTQDITVVIGNPPYSVGQDSQNDDNRNLKYEELDERISVTYAAQSTATLKRNLYDSYIRAIRWASDRIKSEGVVAYVSNGGYIDGNTYDGLRKSLGNEFDAIYCYNLRGNQRTAGEQSRKEGGKIFGSGSRNTVAVLLLVKGGKGSGSGSGCVLYYRDIGDYLSREEKLRTIGAQTLDTVDWQKITPNIEGDWIDQRDNDFITFQALGRKDGPEREEAVFSVYSNGLSSARDAWVYNFSAEAVKANMKSLIDFYNGQVLGFAAHCKASGVARPTATEAEQWINKDSRKISWSSALIPKVARGKKVFFDSHAVVSGIYRPFTRQLLYFDRDLNERPGKMSRLFPTPAHGNFGFYTNGVHAATEPAVLMVAHIPNLDVFGKGGCFFPRYSYRESSKIGDLFSVSEEESGYERVDNITHAALAAYRKVYADSTITEDDIFYYTYGLLHSLEYRDRFAADLKKSLPRIPKARDFWGFAEAGRKLADLHINYEQVEPYKGIIETVSSSTAGVPQREQYRVAKMKIPKVQGVPDRSVIIYNNRVTLTNIPEEAYRYQLGPRSAIEWIIDRYQLKIDKDSGITNDPNDWSDDPRYIIDLLKRIVTLSLETMKIVDHLPTLEILE